MTKIVDDYRAFEDINFNNARSENESFEDYRKRLKQNKQILKMYKTTGKSVFKEMFPAGVGEALKNIEQEKEKTSQ